VDLHGGGDAGRIESCLPPSLPVVWGAAVNVGGDCPGGRINILIVRELGILYRHQPLEEGTEAETVLLLLADEAGQFGLDHGIHLPLEGGDGEEEESRKELHEAPRQG